MYTLIVAGGPLFVRFVRRSNERRGFRPIGTGDRAGTAALDGIPISPVNLGPSLGVRFSVFVWTGQSVVEHRGCRSTTTITSDRDVREQREKKQ